MLIHKSLPTTVKYIGIPTAGVVPWKDFYWVYCKKLINAMIKSSLTTWHS